MRNNNFNSRTFRFLPAVFLLGHSVCLQASEVYPISFTGGKDVTKRAVELKKAPAAPAKKVESAEASNKKLVAKTEVLLPVQWGKATITTKAKNNVVTHPVQAAAVVTQPTNNFKVIDNNVLPTTQVNTSKPVINFANKSAVNLTNVVKRVLQWHPAIKRAMSEVSKSEEGIKEASSGYFPSLKAGLKSSYENANSDIYKGSTTDKLDHNVVLSLTQNIYDFGKTASKVELAKATLDRDKYSQNQTINQMIQETAAAYSEVIRYGLLTQIAQNQVEGFAEINKIAKRRSSLGASAASDYSQAKLRLAAAESTLHNYRAQYNRWSAILDNLTNGKVAKKVKLVFPNDFNGACATVNLDNLQSPEIAVAEAQIKIAEAQLHKMKAEYYPTLSVSPQYEYRLDDHYNMYNKNKKRGDFGVYFNVSVQLLDGGGMSARKGEAEYAYTAAKHNLDYERTQIMQKVMESSSQIDDIRRSLALEKEKVTSAIRTRDLYKQQYIELGTRQFSDLINAESEIHQTRSEIVDNEYTIYQLSLGCLSNSGMLISKFKQDQK